MLENKLLHAHFNNIDLNTHSAAHMYRAVGKVLLLPFAMAWILCVITDFNPAS
jgi:hypothetical protein